MKGELVEDSASKQPRKPAIQTCTDHCVGCGSHFHGLKAFDLHRVGQVCTPPHMAQKARGKATGALSLQVWTMVGYCDKEAGCWSEGKRIKYSYPVTIYQAAGSHYGG